MIEYLSNKQVIVKNLAQAQSSQGVIWFGTNRYPLYTVVKLQPGERPLKTEGHDLIQFLERECYAIYGNGKLLKHGINTDLSHSNQLFFPGWGENSAVGFLATWLLKKANQNMTQADLSQVMQHLTGANLQFWCERKVDQFNPKNEGFLVYGEPTKEQMQAIFSLN